MEMNRDQFGEFECVYWGLKGYPAPMIMRQVIVLTAGIFDDLSQPSYFNL